jgi:hypothetical protein
LTRRRESAREADIDDTTTSSHSNAKNAATTGIGACQY